MGTCIVSFYSGWERRGGELPSPSTEALQWLVYWGIKLFEIILKAMVGIELPDAPWFVPAMFKTLVSAPACWVNEEFFFCDGVRQC